MHVTKKSEKKHLFFQRKIVRMFKTVHFFSKPFVLRRFLKKARRAKEKKKKETFILQIALGNRS
jgi:hypothetical protein